MAYLDQARQDYPDARHHCWAYVLGPASNPDSAAMSDDGEPSGTAGKPILNVMQHQVAGDAMVVVIRYFGGVKLGAGGLVRAYSQATQLAYDSADFERYLKRESYQIQCQFKDEQLIRHWLTKHDGEVQEQCFLSEPNGPEVGLAILLSDTQLADLEAFLAPLKHGAVVNGG